MPVDDVSFFRRVVCHLEAPCLPALAMAMWELKNAYLWYCEFWYCLVAAASPFFSCLQEHEQHAGVAS